MGNNKLIVIDGENFLKQLFKNRSRMGVGDTLVRNITAILRYIK